LVPIINSPFADTAGIYAHPSPANKRKAVEVLAAVFEARRQKEDMIGKEAPLKRAYINLSYVLQGAICIEFRTEIPPILLLIPLTYIWHGLCIIIKNMEG
jgi:hypothetical protein